MTKITTRLWFDEPLWDAVTRRAVAEGTTVRELVPRLVHEALSGPQRIHPQQAKLPTGPDTAEEARPATGAPGPPVMALSETYICSVCGSELKLGAVSQHMNRHLKEHQAAQAERS